MSVTVHAGKIKDKEITYSADLHTLQKAGPLYFSSNPKSIFYTSPQKRTLLQQYAPFLTPANIQKYLIDFVQNKKPCSPRRVYYCLTNFCKKYPELTTYPIVRKDLKSGQIIHETIVLWDEYRYQSRSKPREYLDCFKRRKRNIHNLDKSWDIVICQVSPTYFIATAPVQIVFLEMIHSIQLLQQIPRFLDRLIQDQRTTEKQQQLLRDQCRKEKKPYVRRALNPIHRSVAFPVQSFSIS